MLVAAAAVPELAAERWAAQLAGWGVPQEIVDRAPESPWFHDLRRFEVDDTLTRDSVSSRWARDVLPPLGGTVLDVGCGGGRSSLPLVPPATELIGVDASGAMLDRFVAAAAAVGNPWLLVAASLAAGAGQGVAFRTVFNDVAGKVEASRHAQIVSTVYVITYLGSAVPVVGLGLATAAYGLEAAVAGFVTACAWAAGLLAVITWRRSIRR